MAGYVDVLLQKAENILKKAFADLKSPLFLISLKRSSNETNQRTKKYFKRFF